MRCATISFGRRLSLLELKQDLGLPGLVGADRALMRVMRFARHAPRQHG